MADFTKFKVGSTSYNVKDANAGRKLAVNGNQLQLKNAGGTAISTVTLPGGGGKAVIAEVTAMTTPDQWGTDEQLTVSRYVDGSFNSLNVSDIHDLLANGAVAYISYDNVFIAVDDVSIAGSGFSLSATTTVRDYNKAFGNPTITGNATDTVSINVTYDTITDTAVGNYSTGGGGSSSGSPSYDLTKNGSFNYSELATMSVGQISTGWVVYESSDNHQTPVPVDTIFTNNYALQLHSSPITPPVAFVYDEDGVGIRKMTYSTSWQYVQTNVQSNCFSFSIMDATETIRTFVIFDDTYNPDEANIKRIA